MIIAKIDYINLLPFMIFLKRAIKSDNQKAIINAKKSYPSKINQQFKTKRANAAFISSIKSKSCRCENLGIVAKGEVLSVLALKNTKYQKDIESDTSNKLAMILKQDHQVIIGDKALKYYFHHQGDNSFYDLAKLWNQTYHTPFVFARFCHNSHHKFYQNLAKKFLQTPIKIPYYIKQHYAKSRGLTPAQIDLYLQKIHYKIDHKASFGLKKFFSLAK